MINSRSLRNLIAVRGELVPYIDLRPTFHIQGDAPAIGKIVIVRQEDRRVGLVVDRVLGTHQTVIQSLGRFFRNIKVVSGATIMGDGGVALILDIGAVVRYADRECRQPGSAARVKAAPAGAGRGFRTLTGKERNEELEDRNTNHRRVRGSDCHCDDPGGLLLQPGRHD